MEKRLNHHGTCRLFGDKEKLEIGDKCSFVREPWPFVDVTGSRVEFGDNVVISSGVYILTHNHQFSKKNWRDLKELKTDVPTVIESYAFIGINAIILNSCKYIGKNSVIGAGSVVTRNVPDYEIWAGNPAVKIGDVK